MGGHGAIGATRRYSERIPLGLDWECIYGITDHVRLSLMGWEYELHYGPRSLLVFKCLNVKGTDRMDIGRSRACYSVNERRRRNSKKKIKNVIYHVLSQPSIDNVVLPQACPAIFGRFVRDCLGRKVHVEVGAEESKNRAYLNICLRHPPHQTSRYRERPTTILNICNCWQNER